MSNIKQVVTSKKEEDFISYEIIDIEKYQSTGGIEIGERFLTHNFLLDTLRKIMGKTLTIVDASIYDKQQNKAIKDLIRNVISDEMNFSADWAYDQKILDKMAEEHFKDIPLEDIKQVTIEEALGVE